MARERVSLLYNPQEVGRFRPAPALRAETQWTLGVGEDAVLIGFVGALKLEKGAFRLAAAFNGAMAQRPTLRQVIAPEFHSLHLLRGWTADVRPLYSAMDVLAVPSEWLEPVGRVSIVAQA